MNITAVRWKFKTLFGGFESCSILNQDGGLLYSKDRLQPVLTTTRLVAFQIIKKYLQPQPLDLFVMNDPENGGYKHSKLIFVASLNPNLYLVWDEDFSPVNFKIPPTPLFDKGVQNEFVWKALISPQPFAEDFESFILFQKHRLDNILKQENLINFLAAPATQNYWLSGTNEIFSELFGNKAFGSFESNIKVNENQTIKLKFSAEEKMNLKTITLDFTHTNLASEIHAASHVIESALYNRLIQFYGFGDYLTQSVLDKIKIVLPPKSIVSKSHPQGLFNLELQSIISQLLDFILMQLNTHSRKPNPFFKHQEFLQFQISHEGDYLLHFVDKKQHRLGGIEQLINSGRILPTRLQVTDAGGLVAFSISCDDELKMKVNRSTPLENSEIVFKLNSENIGSGVYRLNKNDQIELHWSRS
jgi:hypothetical protein